MNLQLFAENGDDTGTGTGEGGGIGAESAGTAQTAGKEEPAKAKTFDELLTEGSYQAEFDRRVQKALETQRSKLEVLFDEKATEADKLARMTKEEKAQYQQQKREKELSEKEAAITRRELMAEAKNTLAEKSLPVELSEVLNYSDADSCHKSMEAVETAFQKAVQAGVEDKLKGGTPPKKATQADNNDLAAQVESLMLRM